MRGLDAKSQNRIMGRQSMRNLMTAGPHTKNRNQPFINSRPAFSQVAIGQMRAKNSLDYGYKDGYNK
jgi:hypothetical protein